MLYTQMMHSERRGWREFVIPDFSRFPTGIGEASVTVDLLSIRKELGLWPEFRQRQVCVAWFDVGPHWSQVLESVREWHLYCSLPGDAETKALFASMGLLWIHPWTDGNGRAAREAYIRMGGRMTHRRLRHLHFQAMRQLNEKALQLPRRGGGNALRMGARG